MEKLHDVNKLKYLLKIKIPRRRNFNTLPSCHSHSISFAKNKVSCVVINIRGGEFFKFWNAYFKGRNFRRKKISQISRFSPKSAKLSSCEIFWNWLFAKLNSHEIFRNRLTATLNSHEIFQKKFFFSKLYNFFLFFSKAT